MEEPPPLRLMHSRSSLLEYKLVDFRKLTTGEILRTFESGPERLFALSDGTVMNGHHRLVVLLERGFDINLLPRTPSTRETYGDE